ncbi:MAG: alpha-glucosidase [Firmicutes bacterium]|nr:alpha-glucosidase [Bacillota bacterium]
MDISIKDHLKLSVGKGENNFTMSRGSFSYKQKTQKRSALSKTGERKTEGGYILEFKDQRSGEKHYLSVTDKEGLIRIGYCDENGADISGKGVDRFWVTIPAAEGESIYGCGETYSKFDLKGERVRIFVAEHQNARRIGDKLIRETLIGKRPNFSLPFRNYESYCVAPTYVSSKKYFVHLDISTFAVFDFKNPGTTLLYTQEAPIIYIKQCQSFEEISEEITRMGGRGWQLPDWIYDGAIFAVQGGCDKVNEKIKTAMDAGAKVAGIWSQDWCGCRVTGFGYQVMWNWKTDESLYPKLKDEIAKWKAEGIRFLGYINPFMALEGPLYKYASEKGWCVKDKEGKDYLVTITTFPAAMIDLTNKDAYDWYKSVIQENMIDIGMGGWMADFGEYLPVDSVTASGEDAYTLHNIWPELWAKLNKEAIEERGKTGEVFFFTRAGYTKTAAYSPMMWTGDQHVDWSKDDGLPSVITAMLSLSMSGFGLSHSDAGGYTTVMKMTRDEELLLRWMELGAFSPLMRFHEGNQPSRNVQFDSSKALLDQAARMSRIYASLGWYYKDLAEEYQKTGRPAVRPLFYSYDEKECYAAKDEYMLGSDLLVAPIIERGQNERTVFLPDDEWVHVFTGTVYSGGSTKISAPVGFPPVFVRAKSVNKDRILDSVRNSI